MNTITANIVIILLFLSITTTIVYGHYDPYGEYRNLDQLVIACSDNIRENAKIETSHPVLAKLYPLIEANTTYAPLTGKALDMIYELLNNKQNRFRYFFILPYLIKTGNIRKISDLPQNRLLNIWGTWALDLSGKISHQEARENILKYLNEMIQLHKKNMDFDSFFTSDFFYSMYRALPYIMEEPFEKSRDLILYIFNQPDICRGFSMLPGKSIFSDEIIRFAKNTYGDNLDSLYLGFLERTPDNINALIVHSTTYTGDYTPLVKVFAENYISRKEDKKKRIENLQTILGKWKSNISQFDDVSDISFEEIRNKRREEYSKRNKPNAALDYSDKHPRAWAREQFVKGSEVLENIIKENENKK